MGLGILKILRRTGAYSGVQSESQHRDRLGVHKYLSDCMLVGCHSIISVRRVLKMSMRRGHIAWCVISSSSSLWSQVHNFLSDGMLGCHCIALVGPGTENAKTHRGIYLCVIYIITMTGPGFINTYCKAAGWWVVILSLSWGRALKMPNKRWHSGVSYHHYHGPRQARGPYKCLSDCM